MRPLTALVAIAALAGAAGVQDLAPEANPGATAFVDVSVISMTDAGLLEHSTVVVEDGVVAAVGARNEITVPPGARVIDGRGRFLIPGLVDAHVHIMEEADLRQFLFYGVTTVRNLMGSAQTLSWRDGVADGSLIGPRIVTSGPLFSGPEVP